MDERERTATDERTCGEELDKDEDQEEDEEKQRPSSVVGTPQVHQTLFSYPNNPPILITQPGVHPLYTTPPGSINVLPSPSSPVAMAMLPSGVGAFQVPAQTLTCLSGTSAPLIFDPLWNGGGDLSQLQGQPQHISVLSSSSSPGAVLLPTSAPSPTMVTPSSGPSSVMAQQQQQYGVDQLGGLRLLLPHLSFSQGMSNSYVQPTSEPAVHAYAQQDEGDKEEEREGLGERRRTQERHDEREKTSFNPRQLFSKGMDVCRQVLFPSSACQGRGEEEEGQGEEEEDDQGLEGAPDHPFLSSSSSSPPSSLPPPCYRLDAELPLPGEKRHPGYPVLEIGLLKNQPGLPQTHQYEEEEEGEDEQEGEEEPQGLRKSFENERGEYEGEGDKDSGGRDFYTSSLTPQASAVQYIG
ncbi:hypothetical protein CSUI_006109 [Cystoisospora suis]|uniref:Uncharacterized protein n=1 Tax=Cystoisospora suis TaxID=483139 RepID=A0A2C6KUQ0_9APIC|nr:hypothetical protein CSUI_006109 [Cystoisospora suis]